MAQDGRFVTHRFAGGWDTDSGPTASVPIDDVVAIPFLIDAENVLFERDGGPHKIPGTAKLNSAELESGATVMGLFDFWITGSGSGSTQHRIIHVGTTIKKDDADGSFSDIFTGLTSGAIPCYAVLEDILVIASDSSSDVPRSWDGTTAQNLAGTPPNFSICAKHQNRMWAAGVNGNASRLYYSALLDPEDWVGSGSGSIDIDPNDGDRITAIASHRNELWVFKGPYKGSIHRITGSSPTGDDAFARKTFVDGLGAVNHNGLFRFANDLGFVWSDGSVRSLAATDAFGDYAEAALSRPINVNYLGDRGNLARFDQAWAAVDDILGIVAITIPVDGSSTNNVIIAMDFRFAPARWSLVSAISAACVASVVDSSSVNRRQLMLGGYDGYVRKWGQKDRTNDGTGISLKVTTPHFNYGLPAHKKTIDFASIGFAPKNDASVTFGWQRDNMAQQTTTVTQGGGAQLDSFVLGTDTLGGAAFVDRFMDLTEGGEFRSVRYQVTHSANDEDVEFHSIGARIRLGGISLEN